MSRAAASGRLLLRNYANSLNFPGITGYFNATNSDIAPGSGSFWMALSIKLGSAPLHVIGTTFIIAEFQNFTNNGWQFSLFNNVLDFNMSSAATSATSGVLQPQSTSSVNNFVRLFITCNSATRQLKFYGNGILSNTSSAITAWNITSTTNLLEFGSTSFFGGHNFGCPSYMNDIQFGTGSVPTLSDVQADYFRGVVAPGAKHRWLCNEPSGSTAADSVGSTTATIGNIGAFVSSPTYLKPRVAVSGRVPISNRVHP